MRAARMLWAKLMKQHFDPEGPALARAAHALADLGREPDRAGSVQQRDPHHDRGDGRGARRHAVAAHQRLRRGGHAADAVLGAHRAQHAADPGRGDRHHARDRSARRLVLRREPDGRDRARGREADRRGRGARRHDQGDRGGHAEAAHRGGGDAPPGAHRPRRGRGRRREQVPHRRADRGRDARHRQHAKCARSRSRARRRSAPRATKRAARPRSTRSRRARAARARTSLELAVECARARATVGEISDALERVFGPAPRAGAQRLRRVLGRVSRRSGFRRGCRRRSRASRTRTAGARASWSRSSARTDTTAAPR